jgi:2-(1,2-epoxy-1,2-dihydrophenyl)acetyl-CoA isomerase
MDALPELIETIEDGIATLTFNRPERMNALSTPIMEGLLHGLPRLAGDPAVKVIVLTGAGRAFCAGAMSRAWPQTAASAAAWQRRQRICAPEWKYPVFCMSCRSRRSR